MDYGCRDSEIIISYYFFPSGYFTPSIIFSMEFTGIKTKKLYLEDTYLYECDAKIFSYELGEEGTATIIVDQTCFSPQGGGQPTDEGDIFLGNCAFKVKMVKMNDKHQVVHSGSGSPEFFALLKGGETAAKLKIDQKLRKLYARLHSAGHALDMAMGSIGYGERLIGVKGYHFLDGPHVEYILKGEPLSKEEMDALPGQLSSEMRKLVEADIPTIVQSIEKEQVPIICGADCRNVDLTNYPDTIRMVSLCGMYIPCGGTHIKSSSEIGSEVEVTKVKKKKQTYRVSYTIAD